MAGKSLTHTQGKGCLTHNNRRFYSKNVDSSRTADNVTFSKMTIEEAYDKCFGGAVERYNAKQKRSDRKIKEGYFQFAFDRKPCDTVVTAADKRKSFYEDIVQIGTMEDTGVGSVDAETAKQCLTEYMTGFAERSPNFFVFNAVLHVDEATPHLHIDYIPIAHCKRGLDTQNGIAQALKEMGFGEGKDAISRWRDSERKVLTDICKRHRLEIAPPEKARGSFEVEEYKRYKDNIHELEQEQTQKKKELNQAKQELSKTLNYFPKKSSEDIADKCDQIIQQFNEIKSPIIQKSTAEEYVNAAVKQARTAIKQLDKLERTNYTIRQVNVDGQKTNDKLQEENKQLQAENKELRRELSAAGQRDNAARRLGLADVISDEVERGLEKEKVQARQKEKKRSAEVEL